MTDLIATDAQKQTIDSPLVTLLEIASPGGTIYLHTGLDDDLSNIQFRDYLNNSQINTYVPFPVLLDGLEQASDGAINRPTITVANVGNAFKSALSGSSMKDLIGHRIVRRQTLKKYLYGESPDLSNPPIEFNRVVYTIDRIASENNVSVVYELSSIHDLEGITLPRRTLVGKYCSWQYQGYETHGKGGCLWPSSPGTYDPSGTNADLPTNLFTPFFDVNDNPMAHVDRFSSTAAFSISSSYAKNSIVAYSTTGRYFIATTSLSAAESLPLEHWKEIRTYTHWAAAQSYAQGDLVRLEITLPNGSLLDTVWFCTAAHTSSASNSPTLTSPNWRKEELCSKTLNGCKCRFAGKSLSTVQINGQWEAVMSQTKKLGVTLPFGSFPGAAKFN